MSNAQPPDRDKEPPPSFQPHFATQEEAPRVFSTPWIVGTAGLVVVLAIAFLVMRGGSEEVVAANAPPVSNVDVSAATPPPSHGKVVLPENPLNISKLAIDARSRARTWHADAELVGGHAIIEGGKPRDLEFTFATPRGVFAPGVVLEKQRLTLSVSESGEFSSREWTDTTVGYGSADPNCPLDAAFRTATQAGLAGSARTVASYGYSSKHNREIWTFSSPSAKPALVDADNCAILVR